MPITLETLFNKYNSDKGTLINPKHSYCEFYEKYLHTLREEELLILEIGVCDGKSLKAWYDYFPNSIIIGLDIEDKTKYDNDRVHTFKVDQSSESQIVNFVNECKINDYIFDIIIDDGSHHMYDQQITLANLFTVLKPEGLYFIEDLHTSLADNGYPLYGKRLDIQENRKNTTLFYLMESLNSVYCNKEQNEYLQMNVDYIEIHNKFNINQESQYKQRSITSVIVKK